MGDETQAALMQVIRELLEEMKSMRQDLGDRINRIEQRPAPRPPIRVNLGAAQANPTQNGMVPRRTWVHINDNPEASNTHRQPEDDPGPYYPLNHNPRRAGIQEGDGDEEEEDYNPPPRARRDQNQYQHDEHYNPPPRVRQNKNQYQSNIKLKAPVYDVKVDQEAYLDWEKRMDHIFEYYNHPGLTIVALAVAQLTDNELVWWDRLTSDRRRNQLTQLESWLDMKYLMRQRFVPQHFHRDLQRRFRTLKQGTKSVEEYYEEFESLRNPLGLNEDEESIMAQFVDGLW